MPLRAAGAGVVVRVLPAVPRGFAVPVPVVVV
jgi:hypothetical protein